MPRLGRFFLFLSAGMIAYGETGSFILLCVGIGAALWSV